MSTEALEPTNKWSARGPMGLGYFVIIAMIGSLVYWSTSTNIAGAVVASGVVEVESERQVVQHPDGGVVGQINVRDGDYVAAGDLLVRFDDTFLKSELEIVGRQLLEIYARQVRLEAERDGDESLVFDKLNDFASLDADWVSDQIDGQQSLFNARLETQRIEREQLTERANQIKSLISGMESQIGAYGRQLNLIKEELDDQQGLQNKGLTTNSRVLELRREEARLEGEIGRLTAQIAEARGQIAGINIELLGITDARREQAITTLRDLRFSEIELSERQLSLAEQLSRLDVRAPVDGTIYGSQVFALRSVIRPADPMMFIVPGDQPLQVSAQIDPVHIDQAYVGQRASLRFPTFDQRTTPEISGQVTRISADSFIDEASGRSYYEATVVPDIGELEQLPDLDLRPGMPVEAFLKTQERTPLAYLVQPLSNYFNRAFRED